jgi:hypothetical protein
MTKEEFQAIKKEETPFIEGLNKLFIKLFDIEQVNGFEKVRKTSIGNYVWKVSNCVGEINRNLRRHKFNL